MLGLWNTGTRVLSAIGPLGQSIRGMAYKLKTHSGAAKRLYPTSNGNLKRWKVGRRHLNSGFSAERINRLGKSTYLNGAQKKMAHKLMPYSR
ncbi:hypothetical protein VTP01DRAFT_10573 [Rhizomucor pusillus]|uniref:mitochondrial 54S ribosomal protein bL35m n=1 Tax=Rhizomucor pusillus TaxID=4840 RepID=UPI0037442305